MIKEANNLAVFKVHMKGKSFALESMKEEFTTNEEDIKSKEEHEDAYTLKKIMKRCR